MAPDFRLDGFDDQQIGRLLEFLAQSDVVECEIEQGGCSLSVRRRLREGTRDPGAMAPLSAEGQPDEEPLAARAPAVGIFYRAESRSAPPRVEVGARVKAGDVLGCVEVMGVPHRVVSPGDGVVEGFLVEDGQPVEYGQPLVAIG